MTSSSLKLLKLSALHASRAMGLYQLVRDSGWRRDRLLIVCYHGVSLDDEHEWAPALYMRPGLFESRLARLRVDGYSVLRLDDALDRLSRGTLPPRSVALTFDDGAADFAIRAYPVLERFGYPATVYLTTHYCGHPKPVFDVFTSYLLWKGRDRRIQPRAIIGTRSAWQLDTEVGRGRAVTELHDFARHESLSTADKDALAERLARALGLDYDGLVERRLLQLMTPEEVTRLAAAGVRFELHTHRHRIPSERDAFDREIAQNRSCIADLTSTEPHHFCYPSGVHEPEWLPWLGDSGIRSATTCETGLTSRRTHPLLLPRFVDGEHQTELEFESWTTGLGAFLPRRRAHAPAGAS